MSVRNAKTLPAVEVKERFGRILNEISRNGGPIIIERGGKAVAVILSMGMFKRLRPGSKRTRNRRALALSAFGMWADRSDIDEEWLARGRARWQNEWAD